MASEPLLAHYEENTHQDTEHDEADDLGRIPRKYDTPKVESKKHHESQAEDGKTAKPINSLDAIHCFGTGIVHIQEDEEKNECEAFVSGSMLATVFPMPLLETYLVWANSARNSIARSRTL